MQKEGGGSGRAATHSARAGGFAVAEAAQTPPLRDRQEPSWGNDHLATDESVEGEVVVRAEEHKECIIDLVFTARQRDELCDVFSQEIPSHVDVTRGRFVSRM